MSVKGEFVAGVNIHYPEAQPGDTIDLYHGVEVIDPFRWMELDSPERERWIADQARLVETYGPDPELTEAIHERFRGYFKPVMDSVYERRGDRRFFERITVGSNYPVFFERLADGSEREILDPNSWSEDGSVAPGDDEISPKGNYLAIAHSINDNDLQNWRVLDINTTEWLSDILPPTHHSSAVWLKDETGFYYERVDGDQQSIYFHRLHTNSEADEAIFIPEVGDETIYEVDISDDQQWLYILGEPLKGSNFIDVRAVDQPNAPFVRLVDVDVNDTNTYLIHGNGAEHILWTDRESPRGRLVKVNLGESNWTEFIPESVDVLNTATVICDRLICEYYNGFCQYVIVFDLNGQELRRIYPPGEVGVATIYKGDYDDPEIYVTLENLVISPTTYTYNVLNGEMQKIKDPDTLIDTSNMLMEVRYATSADGTQVPMFVCRQKDIELNGDNPTILYGYGGFNIPELPEFSTGVAGWIDMGGVFVIAGLRGGGEFGKSWYEAGRRLQKKRSFEDFIACAEQLIASGITRPEKLASKGGSNGGLLVTSCMLQRPDLFGAVLPGCAVLDMLRCDKDEQYHKGRHWTLEYGSTDNKEDFENLYSYSPVHNVAPANYPPVYAAHGVHDDRVLPWHSYKFIAALQTAQLGNAPVLLDVDHISGHSISGFERYYAEIAKQYAFLIEQFDMQLNEYDTTV